jgi:drug/metabolite transporter (DMT)-like permease
VNNHRTVPSLGVMLAGALWGLLWYPVVEFDKQGLGVGLSSAIFYAVTALCALPGILISGTLRQITQTPLSYVVMGTAFTLYTFALLLTHPINAILLFYLTPAWSILLGKLLFREPVGLLRVLVVVMGFTGVGLVLGATSLPLPKVLGDWIALASGALWALGTTMSNRVTSQDSSVRLMQFAVAGLISTGVLALLLSGAAPKVLTAAANTNILMWAIVIGFVLFAIPNLLVIWGTSRLSSTRVGVLLMMEVVVGTIAIALLSTEPLVALQIVGAVLIFAAGIVEVISRDSHAVPT